MPVYEYYCQACENLYDLRRAMAERDDPAPCPICSAPGRRQISTFGYKYEGHYFMGHSSERRRTDPHD